MPVKISITNSKLGAIPSVNLPPIITCRTRCPCSKDCYALKGNFRFKNVKDSLLNNYTTYLDNPKSYFKDIKHFINNGIASHFYFRWHGSGDIVDARYFEGIIDVANDLPLTSFLSFTKKFELVNAFIGKGGVIPQNLHIVFSAWGDNFKFDNPYDFPVAYVRFKNKENSLIPNNAVKCSGNCSSCLRCWDIKNGEAVVFSQH